MGSITFVTWAPRTLAVYERARHLKTLILSKTMLGATLRRATRCQLAVTKPSLSLPNPRQSHQRPPETANVRQDAAEACQRQRESANVRQNPQGLARIIAMGRKRPPNPASVCQDSAEVRQSPRESSGMRLCPPWSARAEPIPAKACQSLPKPPPNRQSPPKLAKRPPRHRAGSANENTPRKRPS